MKDDTQLCEELLSQLQDELNETWDQLKEIKEELKQGMGPEQYTALKIELEARIDELTKRIYYLDQARSKILSKEDRIHQEAELLMNEYQLELIDNMISHVRIFLTVSVHKTWIIEINFADPKVPLFRVPTDLPKMIGNIYETIDSLKEWHGSPKQHLVNIVREIEEKLLNLELAKSLPELELERGRIMDQAKKLETKGNLSDAIVFYNYAADISERIGNQAIAMVCRVKAKKLEDEILNQES